MKHLSMGRRLLAGDGTVGRAVSNVLDEIVIRRTRQFIKKAYPEATIDGKNVHFPRRLGKLSMDAELNETPTAKKIVDALPIKTGFNTWGDEIYFAIPVTGKRDESAKEVVEVGDLGYWPTGKAFCIFFGQTPVSEQGKIMPASAVNVIGKVIGNATQFKKVMNESQVTLEAV